GPHSQVQNVAEITTATGVIPVVCPYRYGSMNWPMIGSVTRNKPPVKSVLVQPGSTAKLTAIGKAAAIHAPRYGTKRSSIARIPHRTGFGTPINVSPIPTTSPNSAFTEV